MKKKLGLGLLSVAALVGLASCNNTEVPSNPTASIEESSQTASSTKGEETPSSTAPAIETMTYSEFMAAEVGDDVRVQGYISAKQFWWNNAAVVYLTGAKGEGYLIYNFPMTQEEYNTKYTIGTCVNVKGLKAAYAGLQEIDGSKGIEVEVVENAKPYTKTPVDITASVKDEDLVNVQNAFFEGTLKVKEYTTTSSDTKVSDNKAYGYKGDAPTDDLYILFEDANGNVLSACLESYLTNKDSEVYQFVLNNLEVGKTYKIEGYMYWWNGANPHITSITLAE